MKEADPLNIENGEDVQEKEIEIEKGDVEEIDQGKANLNLLKSWKCM